MGGSYEDCLKRTKERVTTQNRQSGQVVQDIYRASSAKPIIDEIDTVLAKHYGFTEEELEFILNYDIKYRLGLGRDGGGEDDDTTEDE